MSSHDSCHCNCSKTPFEQTGAKWIWPAEPSGDINQYLEFRHEFELAEICKDSKIYISVDSEYAVWVNGQFVHCGQYHDFPDDKTYDTLDLSGKLTAGKNTLCIIAYYQGEGSFQYLHGDPGLVYALVSGCTSVVSGEASIYRLSKAYHNGDIARITPQLGFTFAYDTEGDDGWRCNCYKPNLDWTHIYTKDIKPLESRKVTRPRPIKKLDILDRVQTKVVSQGVFTRLPVDGLTVAEQMQSDFLSMTVADQIFSGSFRVSFPSEEGVSVANTNIPANGGVYVVIDLGREEAGVFDIDIEVPTATVVDVAWGEHLDDLRVRASIGGRNFAARLTCKPGRQTFTHYFKRMAGRYLQLHILNPQPGTKIYYAGLLPTEYPLQVPGEFNSPDTLQKKIFDTAIRTLHLCMHEHYEDCPWREQALYGMDSRNQALTGYYCFGEYDFPAASFKLLGDSLQEDGYQELCAPMTFSITIPSFSMAWILETAEQYLHSGNLDTAKTAYPTVAKMVNTYIASMSDGVLPCPVGDRFWQFYDWADGLDGTAPGTDGWKKVEGKQLDSTFNGFYALALISAVSLAEACGFADDAFKYRTALGELKSNFHNTFYDTEAEAYLTSIGEGISRHFAELPQALAILTGLAPVETAAQLREKLASENNGMTETTLSQSLYKFESLLQDPDKYAPWVFSKVAKDWSYMLQNGATSFWETIKGGDDFGNAGSLCHGWSGTPVYLYQAYILGIRPTSPGFKTFKLEPITNVVDKASGIVPTPYGCVEVCWKKVDGEVKHKLNHPTEIESEIKIK